MREITENGNIRQGKYQIKEISDKRKNQSRVIPYIIFKNQNRAPAPGTEYTW